MANVYPDNPLQFPLNFAILLSKTCLFLATASLRLVRFPTTVNIGIWWDYQWLRILDNCVRVRHRDGACSMRMNQLIFSCFAPHFEIANSSAVTRIWSLTSFFFPNTNIDNWTGAEDTDSRSDTSALSSTEFFLAKSGIAVTLKFGLVVHCDLQM